MRSWMPTVVALILCIGGFWYASSQDFFREQPEEAEKLLQEVTDDVTSIQILNTDGTEPVKLIKEDAGWRMELPDAYPLNAYSVDDWVTSLDELTIATIAEEHADELGKYGLLTPMQRYEVELKDGTKLELEVGDETPVTGTVYARLGDSNKVYVLNQSEIHSLQMTALDFAEKDPLVFLADQVTAIDWNWSGMNIKGARTDESNTENQGTTSGTWRINDTGIELSDMITWLNSVRFQQTDQLPKHIEKLTDDGVMNTGPAFTLDMTLEKSQSSLESNLQTVRYLGYRDGDTLWVLLEGNVWAYAVSSAEFDELNVQMTELLDSAKQAEQQAEQETGQDDESQ